MKVALASDLHLEFGDIRLHNTEQADVLVLAGDILVAEVLERHPNDTSDVQNPGPKQKAAKQYRDFLRHVSEEFPNVVYVAGNHEFYDGKWQGSIDVLIEECLKLPNVHFLEDSTVELNGINFVGCTMWTDCNKGDPATMHVLSYGMNDYKLIRNDALGYIKLRPAHTASRHASSKKFVAKSAKGTTVVVTHHAPSTLSIPARFKNGSEVNGGYVSDLSELILDNPSIKLWCHGHTHDSQDYMIGSTRVVCNPRGYIGYEPEAADFKLQYYEV